MDLDDLLPLFRELERHHVDYVLVGGVAVNLHGIVRATEDVDLFVRADPDNVARMKLALRAVWPDPDIDQIAVDDLATHYNVIRYGPPDVSLVVDLIARLGTAFEYADLEAETMDVAGAQVRVATPRTLVRMKRDTVRMKDRMDAEDLRRKFKIEE